MPGQTRLGVSAKPAVDLEVGKPHAVPHGAGRVRLPDGTSCGGRWMRGLLHGKGTITDPSGQNETAIWHNGKYKGTVWPDLTLGRRPGVARPNAGP